MRIVRARGGYAIRLDESPPVNRHRPAVDVLFDSAMAFKRDCIAAVLLTGMGDDGARAMKHLHDLGVRTLAQDEASCVVFGMPRALFPQIAHENFGDPVEGGWVFGALFAAMSVGAVLGGVLSGWTSRVARQGLAVIVMIVLWGLAIGGFGVAAHFGWLWAALVLLALGGAADMFSAAFRTTMLQEAATDDVRGRLQGVFTVVVAGGPRIGGIPVATWIAGLGGIWALIAAWPRRRRR